MDKTHQGKAEKGANLLCSDNTWILDNVNKGAVAIKLEKYNITLVDAFMKQKFQQAFS